MTTGTSTISKSQEIIITWVLFGVVLAFFIARLVIRLRVYGHLKVDDGLVFLATLCLLASNILWEVTKDTAIAVQNVKVFHEAKPTNFQQDVDNYAKYVWVDAYLFFTGVWAVKGAFLAFYDGLTKRLVDFRRAWWAAIIITILTYVGSLFAYAFLDGTHYSSPNTSYKNEAINYQFSADFLTDVVSAYSNVPGAMLKTQTQADRMSLVTAIPLTIAFKSQVPTKQKLALAGVFSLSLIITAISTIRFALNQPGRNSGPSWIQTWSTIEQSIAVIVACLASFRTLVISNKHNSSRRNEKNESGSTPRKNRFPSDNFGFAHLRSYGESSTPKGSMDIELLESGHGLPRRTAGSKVDEVPAIAIEPIGLKINHAL